MRRAFGTNITNTVSQSCVPHTNFQTADKRKQYFSNIPNSTHLTVDPPHSFNDRAAIGYIKPRPGHIPHDDVLLYQNSNSQPLPVKPPTYVTHPKLLRSISENAAVQTRVRLKHMPNILRRKRKTSSTSSLNQTPVDVSVNTTPVIEHAPTSIKLEDIVTDTGEPSCSNEYRKPPYSYMAMIQFAIESAGESRKMTLKDIYLYIQRKFPYFKKAKPGWKNSVRHNLSLHPIFVREATGNSKTSYWCMRSEKNDPSLIADYDEFGRKPEKRRRKERKSKNVDDSNKENIPPAGYQRLPNLHPSSSRTPAICMEQEIVLLPIEEVSRLNESAVNGVHQDSFDAIVDKYMFNDSKPELSLSHDSFTKFIDELGSPFTTINAARRSEKKRRRLPFTPNCSSTPAFSRGWAQDRTKKPRAHRALLNELEHVVDSKTPQNQTSGDSEEETWNMKLDANFEELFEDLLD